MSGICGLIDFGAGFEGATLRSLMSKMQQAMIHRGFERDSFWIDAQKRVALSDCHLLTSQKPAWIDPELLIQTVYDGDELTTARMIPGLSSERTTALQGLVRSFADASKSPVAALRAIESPFALALWNDRLKKLLLARDSFDSKPLFFAHGRGWFAFASELRALRTIPGFSATLDLGALGDYLSTGGVRATRSICREANKVAAGGFVELDCAPLFASASMISIRASDHATRSVTDLLAPTCSELNSSQFHSSHQGGDDIPADLALSERVELLRRALLESMQQSELRSGGVHLLQTGSLPDCLVAAMFRAELAYPTHTYGLSSMAGAESAGLAGDVAKQIGATHRACDPIEDVRELVDRVAIALDEPQASMDAIPLSAIAAFARMNSSRAVSGAGASEYFGNVAPGSVNNPGPTRFLPAVLAKFRKPNRSDGDAHDVKPGLFWSAEDLRAAGFAAASAEAMPRESTIPLVTQVCMHNSLAVSTPFLDLRVARLGGRGSQMHGGGGALVHLLRHYLPEPLVRRIAAGNLVPMSIRAEQSLAQLCDSLLFEPESRILKLTNRIALRGLLACPAASPRLALGRRWSLILLEAWLRRQPELAVA